MVSLDRCLLTVSALSQMGLFSPDLVRMTAVWMRGRIFQREPELNRGMVAYWRIGFPMRRHFATLRRATAFLARRHFAPSDLRGIDGERKEAASQDPAKAR